MNPVQTNIIGGSRYWGGTCYIVIPAGVDRDSYVNNCYRQGSVSVQFEDGSFMNEIPIGLSILKDIDFPDDVKKLGSQLVYMTMPVHNKPIIIDRILKDDESNDLSENQFKLSKCTDSGSVSISGIAKNGNLFINVEGYTEKGGKIFIDVTNPDNKGEIIINLKGDLKAELQNMILNILQDLNISSKNDINLVAENKINLGSGAESLLKGDTTTTQLEIDRDRLQELQSGINSWVPVPNDGGAALKTSLTSWLSKVMANYDDIKSEKSFTE